MKILKNICLKKFFLRFSRNYIGVIKIPTNTTLKKIKRHANERENGEKANNNISLV